MSVNTCLIYRCLSSASAVIRLWFIYELQKSTTIAFSRNSLYTFYSRNPTCGIPPCLRISNRKYPPCPQNSIIVNPPSPSEILKAVRGIVWIFSGIAHSTHACWIWDDSQLVTTCLVCNLPSHIQCTPVEYLLNNCRYMYVTVEGMHAGL